MYSLSEPHMNINISAYAFAILNCAAVDLHLLLCGHYDMIMIIKYVPTVTDNS